MSRIKIQMITNIHKACTTPLYDVLDRITETQLNWKPAPDSRGIGEIMNHLIRVDNKFLTRLGEKPKAEAPINGSSKEILNALQSVHSQMHSLVEGLSDDSMLFEKSPLKNAEESDTIKEHVLHSCHHNLYHLAQVIYLRRAQDREWISPVGEWDKATRIIANYLSAA